MKAEFLGYRIQSTSLVKLEKILSLAKRNIFYAATNEYHRMLSETICELIDDITLGIRQRPNRSILEEATEILNDTISRAEIGGMGTEYDMRVMISLIPDTKYTYIILSVSNEKLLEAFETTEGIEAYKVSSEAEQAGDHSEAAHKWDELRKRCEEKPSIFSANLTNRLNVNPDKLKYDSPLSRAKVRARQNMTSRLLNQYACGKEIQSAQLMPLLDKALLRLMDDDIQQDVNAMVSRLAMTLIDITPEIVQQDPRQAVAEVAQPTPKEGG